MENDQTPSLKALLNYLNLHPRIPDAEDLFEDKYHWEAECAASKALVIYVKSDRTAPTMDGASLMRSVFSKKCPVLAFNELKD